MGCVKVPPCLSCVAVSGERRVDRQSQSHLTPTILNALNPNVHRFFTLYMRVLLPNTIE